MPFEVMDPRGVSASSPCLMTSVFLLRDKLDFGSPKSCLITMTNLPHKLLPH
ncbi:hypothetical protein CK203_003958 [Vitis vinifera]|uniref:Uncharacterized protein n=1 Tax=Vitis vinifera TaxID=29760 RepID=A0A438K946_VITVI|nr:hypothetical protein CK203_003958 [Vitis vinifera]